MGDMAFNFAIIPPRFTKARRLMTLGLYGLRHGPKVFERLNRTNLFLARQFEDVSIECNVCGKTAEVWFSMLPVDQCREHKVGLLRETLECLACLSRMRYRIMAFGLLEEYRRRTGRAASSIEGLTEDLCGLRVLDTDAYSPIAKLLSPCEGYLKSSYMSDRPPGRQADGDIYNVDLQAIPFPDETFDIILSTDVMEHVRSLEAANQDIYRCLKPGGVHIFTVPFDQPALTTRTLIDTSTGEDIYLEPPQIHGDDHLSGGIPAYRIFGMDLLDHLRAAGFEADLVHIPSGVNGIYGGSYFRARRPSIAAPAGSSPEAVRP